MSNSKTSSVVDHTRYLQHVNTLKAITKKHLDKVYQKLDVIVYEGNKFSKTLPFDISPTDKRQQKLDALEIYTECLIQKKQHLQYLLKILGNIRFNLLDKTIKEAIKKKLCFNSKRLITKETDIRTGLTVGNRFYATVVLEFEDDEKYITYDTFEFTENEEEELLIDLLGNQINDVI